MKEERTMIVSSLFMMVMMEVVLFLEMGQTVKTAFEKSNDTYFLAECKCHQKESTITGSYELIFKMEEIMLGKHICFETTARSK